MAQRSKTWRFLVGQDQSLNPIIFNGSEDVTLSSQLAYRELIHGKSRFWRKLVDYIFLKLTKEVDHCYNSLVDEADEFGDEEAKIREELKKLGIG